MKYRLILLIIIIVMSCSHVMAQDFVDIDKYDRETIYIHYSFLGDGFVKNGEIIKLGVLGSGLAKEMTGSEYALEEMQRARKHRIAGIATGLAATTLGLTGVVLAFWGDESEIRAFEITSLIVGGICGVVAEGFNKSAMASMNRAVWLYNRDVTSGQLRY